MTELQNKANSNYEVDQLKYRGYAIPKVVKLFWVVFVIGFFYYLFTYAYPDLREWMNK